MRIQLLCLLALAACADSSDNSAPALPAPVPASEAPGPSATGPGTTTTSSDPDEPAPSTSTDDDDDDGGAPVVTTPASTCTKQLTVILTVGVPGLSKWQTNGCWKPVVTDGAAVSSYRKCSTSSFKVTNNPAAPNWAYDDTNPTHNATTEKTFFDTCSDGATGNGYVFMAYNDGWRYLSTSTVKAHFAELYTSEPTDIDSHYAAAGVYQDNATLKAHADVYPMMNYGPPASANLQAKVKTEAAKLCATLKDGGYLGLYNASWQDSMAADDARLMAVESALDACTQ